MTDSPTSPVTVITTGAAPTATSPSVHDTVADSADVTPAGATYDVGVKPGGALSVTVTERAVDGPLLVTVICQLAGRPGNERRSNGRLDDLEVRLRVDRRVDGRAVVGRLRVERRGGDAELCWRWSHRS